MNLARILLCASESLHVAEKPVGVFSRIKDNVLVKCVALTMGRLWENLLEKRHSPALFPEGNL